MRCCRRLSSGGFFCRQWAWLLERIAHRHVTLDHHADVFARAHVAQRITSSALCASHSECRDEYECSQ